MRDFFAHLLFMSSKIDLTGKRIGKLVVISECKERTSNGKIKWICLCDCGKETVVWRSSLRNGSTKSCGCLRSESCILVHTTHGKKHTVEYNTWARLIDRCTNPNFPKYNDYGGRGIGVCDRWRYSFENFYEDMGPRPSNKHSIDRYPNNDGNYEPPNCRWATNDEQQRNKRNNRWVEYEGKKMIAADWARYLGINDLSHVGFLLKTMTIEQIVKKYQKIE